MTASVLRIMASYMELCDTVVNEQLENAGFTEIPANPHPELIRDWADYIEQVQETP